MRVTDMDGPQLQEHIVAKMFSHEGHLPKITPEIDKLKAGTLAKKKNVLVLLPKFRLSYPALAEPKEETYKGVSKNVYKILALFEPDQMQNLYTFYRTAFALASTRLGKYAQPYALSLTSGASMLKNNEDYLEAQAEKGRDITSLEDTYPKGGMYMNVSRKADYGRPLILNNNKKPLESADDIKKELYAGCYCQGTVEIGSLDDKLYARLVAVIKVADGDRLGSSSVASVDDFTGVNTVASESTEPSNLDVTNLFGTPQA